MSKMFKTDKYHYIGHSHMQPVTNVNGDNYKRHI